MSGLKEPHTATLARGQQCTVKVDATDWVARVTFDNNALLGVDIPGYKIVDVYTVPRGTSEDIIVYNGDQTNTISFIITFTGAMRIVVQATAAILTFGMLMI